LFRLINENEDRWERKGMSDRDGEYTYTKLEPRNAREGRLFLVEVPAPDKKRMLHHLSLSLVGNGSLPFYPKLI
jgi:hypothetical protein